MDTTYHETTAGSNRWVGTSGHHYFKRQTVDFSTASGTWANTVRNVGAIWEIGCIDTESVDVAHWASGAYEDTDSMFSTNEWYLSNLVAPDDGFVSFATACRGYSTCASHQVCIVDDTRLSDELSIGFGTAHGSIATAAGEVARGATNWTGNMFVLNSLLGENLAILRSAVQGNTIQQATAPLYRHAAGSTILELAAVSGGSGISLVVATLVDSAFTESNSITTEPSLDTSEGVTETLHGDYFSIDFSNQAGATKPTSATVDIHIETLTSLHG